MTETLLQSNDDHIEIDENKDYLSELVGDGKKFKDFKDLAKGKYYADRQIEIQNRRIDQLRDDFIKERNDNIAKAKLQEYVDRLQTLQTPPSNDTPPANGNQEKPAINMDEIKSLMSNQIQEYESNKRQQDNFNQVQTKLVERYGKNYSTALGEQLQTLGMTAKQIDDLAKQTPQAAMRILGLDRQPQQENFQSPPHSSQRNDKFAPQGAKKRTWSYYQELKKANPTLYLDRKIANQMVQDAAELGEEFNDGDFYVAGLHEK